jgi:hypothetical protein
MTGSAPTFACTQSSPARHREERSDVAISSRLRSWRLLRCARNNVLASTILYREDRYEKRA